jgi:hypothetical protein
MKKAIHYQKQKIAHRFVTYQITNIHAMLNNLLLWVPKITQFQSF